MKCQGMAAMRATHHVSHPTPHLCEPADGSTNPKHGRQTCGHQVSKGRHAVRFGGGCVKAPTATERACQC